jgi:hypothetical protein
LFRGDTSGIHFNHGNSSWRSNSHNLEVAQHSPTRCNPSLHVLTDSVARHPHSSAKELSKFGFLHDEARPLDASSRPSASTHASPRMNSSLLSFGSFPSQIDVCKESNIQLKKTFIGSNCAWILCARLPIQTLEFLEDQRQAGYDEEEIMQMLNLPFIRPNELSFEFIGRCFICGHSDHLQPNCPGVCLGCQRLGHKCH